MQKSNKDGKKVRKGVRRVVRVEKYAEIRATRPDLSKKAAARAAGYGPKTHPVTIEETHAFRDIQQRVEEAQAASGFNVMGNLKRLQTIVSRKGKAADRNAIAAIKVGTEITGERMPETIKHSAETDAALLGALLGRPTATIASTRGS